MKVMADSSGQRATMSSAGRSVDVRFVELLNTMMNSVRAYGAALKR
jgi:hypothetical protein